MKLGRVLGSIKFGKAPLEYKAVMGLKLLPQSKTQMIFVTARVWKKVGTKGKKREGLLGGGNLFETDLKALALSCKSTKSLVLLPPG